MAETDDTEIFRDLATLFHYKWTASVFAAALHYVAARDINPRGRKARAALDRLIAAVKREEIAPAKPVPAPVQIYASTKAWS